MDRFLDNLPYENWANAHFKGKHYSDMTSNAVESFNAWIIKAQILSITSMVDTIRGQIMNQMGCRLAMSY